MRERLETLRLLLNEGAQDTLKDTHAHTARDIANNLQECVDFLNAASKHKIP